MNLQKLIDVYPSWTVSGIFTDLQNKNVPWKDANIDNDLNIAYYGQHSGDKIISPFIEKFLSDDGELGTDAREKIASAIFSVCGDNWNKLWQTTIQQYDLLDNTNAYISETTTTEQNTDTTDNGTNTGTVTHAITGSDTTTDSGTVDHAITGSDTTTDSGTVEHGTTGKDTTTETGTVSTEGTTGTDRTVNNDIYGFNSPDPSNADKQTGNDKTTANQTETRNLSSAIDHGTTETETRELTNKLEHNTDDLETRNLTNTVEHNTQDKETRDLSDFRTGNEKMNGTVTHEMHRHGNIGVTTSQQMLQEERELWQWYFYEYVFKDLDRFLVISVY